MPDVYEEIEKIIQTMYNLEADELAEAVEKLSGILKSCVVDVGVAIDTESLDSETHKLIHYFSDLESKYIHENQGEES